MEEKGRVWEQEGDERRRGWSGMESEKGREELGGAIGGRIRRDGKKEPGQNLG